MWDGTVETQNSLSGRSADVGVGFFSLDWPQNVKHPNIVRLFDVIETEKYIGIILDFANGELRR
jgi:hypothetical protein